MKIVFFEIQGWENQFLKQALKGHKVEFYKEELNEKNISKAKDADVVSVFTYSQMNKKILSLLPKLKLITTRSTGYDHIDLNECKKRKIVVCSVPRYGENTVAEHTFALLLDISRNIHKAYLKTSKNDFSIEGLKGFDLKGKTIGIIGMGSIGSHVVRIANGFEMNVLVYTRHPDIKLAKQLNYKNVSLKELLNKSDVITIHTPLTKETHHLINKTTIKQIKKGAILINTARGGIVDTKALIRALDKGIIRAVGLDVLEGEELIKEEKQMLYDKQTRQALKELAEDHVLLSKDNVIFTPHVAFYSDEALQRIIATTAENILSFNSKKLINVVQEK